MNQENIRGSTTKKGSIGERILERIIRVFFPGANIYFPCKENGAHQCDAIVIARKSLRIVLVDAKAKPAMSFYPESGIDESHYKLYMDIGRRHRALVFLCFIDEANGMAYGNFLQILKRKRKVFWNGKNLSYPRDCLGSTGLMRMFPIEFMRQLAELTHEEIEELKKTSTRNKEYKPNPKVYARLGNALVENSFHPKQKVLMNVP